MSGNYRNARRNRNRNRNPFIREFTHVLGFGVSVRVVFYRYYVMFVVRFTESANTGSFLSRIIEYPDLLYMTSPRSRVNSQNMLDFFVKEENWILYSVERTEFDSVLESAHVTVSGMFGGHETKFTIPL